MTAIQLKMANPNNESSANEGSFKERKQYDVRIFPRHFLFPYHKLLTHDFVGPRLPDCFQEVLSTVY